MVRIVTQGGPLPHTNPEDAVAYSQRHDIPFLPELPALQELMPEIILRPGQLHCLELFKQNSYKTVKIQCVGPATLYTLGYSEESEEIVIRYIDALLDGLVADNVLLFLDEPALGEDPSYDYREGWSRIFQRYRAIRGVQIYKNRDWNRVGDADIEFISIDASLVDIASPHYNHKKCIAWGIREKGDIQDFQPGDLITLTSPARTPYPLEEAEKVFDFLQETAQEFR